jgi:hypothetical protein
MKTGKRHIKSGDQFNAMFPIPEGKTQLIKKAANLEDTLKLMKQITATTLEDTVTIAEYLKASTEKQTCSNIWNFCFNHLQYTKDEMGKEQVRRPSRVWQDRKEGVDCDCMSVFIGSILTNLGIPFAFRLTKYQSPEFEHVYPIAYTKNGVLILDAVVHKFNREVPYSAKKDIKMDLEYLNGFDEDAEFDQFTEIDEILENDFPIDAQGIVELEGLEGRAERQARKAKRKAKRAEKKANRPPLKERLKKGLNVINKFNPATALLRAGVLASMKLNVMNVASKLRFAYWSDSQARQNNMDLNKFNQLKRIREKMEKIFFGAGGKTENLKKAILSGKGNRDRRVTLNGLGEIIYPVHDDQDLRTILGDELFEDEVGESGVNGLGAVATASAIAAASGVIGTLAALIKKLGSLFKSGSPQADQEIVQDNTAAEEEKTRRFSFKNLVNNFKNRNSNITDPTTQATAPIVDPSIPEDQTFDPAMYDDEASFTRSAEVTPEDKPDEKKGVVGWIKEHPLLTAGIATAVVGGTILAVRAAKKKKGLAGVPKKKKTKSKPTTAKKRKTPTRKKPVRKKPTRRRKKPVKRSTSVRKVELL